MIELPNARDVELMVADWRHAWPDLAALLDKYGLVAPVLQRFGVMQWQARRFDLAAKAFEAALALAPHDPRIWRELAGAYEGCGTDARALFCVARAIELDPADSLSYLMRAGIEGRLGDKQAAERAYRQALDLNATLADAHLGLGLLNFEQQRPEEAVASFRRAVEHAPDHALAQTCLAHALYNVGDFKACAVSFESAAVLGPLDAASRRKFAYAQTLQTMIESGAQQALDAYPAIAGEQAEDVATVARDAFGLLSGYGHLAAAADVGRLLVARNPDDPVQRYLLDAVNGARLERAPADYLERYFDGFASTFEQKLVDGLGYHVPQRLAELVAKQRDAFDAILDLGCGTGLAADHLARFKGRLTGVDLSTKMLEAAKKRGVYAELLQAEAVAFLQSAQARFDLVFTTDMLIYIGDLAPLFAGVAARLSPAGLFALSVETTGSDSFALLPSGRFAHACAYVEAAASSDFDVVETEHSVIRLEGRRPVDGQLFVLRRR